MPLLLPLLLLGACRSQPEWRRRAALLLREPGFPRPQPHAPRCLTDETLAAGLRAAVRSARFDAVWDYGPLYGEGCPSAQAPACQSQVGPLGAGRYPQLDLSVIVPNRAGCVPAVAKATVLYDRAHPDGVVGEHDPKTLELTNVRLRKWDEARFNGGRWQLQSAGQIARIIPSSELPFDAPYPPGSLLDPRRAVAPALDFMSPWPASVFKLMVATRLLQLLDRARTEDGQPLDLTTPIELPPSELVSACPQAPGTITLRQALETMLQWSGNCATAALVRYLHAHGEIVQSTELDAQGYPVAPPLQNRVNEALASLGLGTLQMNRTIARSGRWGNANDNYDARTASVANNHMTSWDTARLLWLFDDLPPAAQPRWEVAPGRPVERSFVSAPRKELLRSILADSYSGSGLVSNRTCVTAPNPAAIGPPPAPGILARLADKWLDGGRLRSPFADYPYPGVVDELGPDSASVYSLELSPCQRAAEVVYLNKAGLTNVAASSVGIVRGLVDAGRHFQRHYIVSFFSSLGSRFADEAAMKAVGLERDAHRLTHLGTTQAIPTLGANLDAWLALWLED